jgi:hypothetical protein
MFIIFNLAGVSFCVLALFGGWGVQFAAWALGFDESAKDLSDLDLSHRLTGLPTREDVHMSKPMATYSDILAALHDVERSGGSFLERSIARGFFLGPPICLVACVILGNLLVLAGPHRDEAFTESMNIWTGVYGFFLGLFVGPLVDAIRKEKKAIEQVLEKAMATLNVSANDVGRVLHDHQPQLPKSAGALARLRKRKVV